MIWRPEQLTREKNGTKEACKRYKSGCSIYIMGSEESQREGKVGLHDNNWACMCVYIYIIDLRIKDWVRKGLSIKLFFFWWTASHFMWSSTLKSSISLLYSCHRFSLHHENLQARSLSNSFCWQIEVLIESIKVCGSLQCIQDSITLKPGIDNFNRKNSTQEQSQKWCFQSKN